VADLKATVDKHLGPGYYDFILKMGVVAGVPTKRLEKELGTTAANIEAMKRDYRSELQDLRVHGIICNQVFDDLVKVRMVRILMKILDQLEEAINFGGEMEISEKIDAMKFMAKYIGDFRAKEESAAKKSDPAVDPKELKERALRLLKNE
jgi:hypothetical protein